METHEKCPHGYWVDGCHHCTPSASPVRPPPLCTSHVLAWTTEAPCESGTYIYRRWSSKRREWTEPIHVELRGSRAFVYFEDGKSSIPLERILRAKWLGEAWWFGPLPKLEPRA